MSSNASIFSPSPGQVSALHVCLLGNFSLFCDRTPVDSIDTPRLQSLLAYLVLHRGAPLSRQHIAFTLWPDSSEAHARGSLRKLLFQLTAALPQSSYFLEVNAQTVQWRLDAPFTLDVDEFEKAVAGASSAVQWRVAIALYRGDLLPSCYEDWILPERERLRQAFLQALERLVLLLESERDYRGAIDYTQMLLRHNPLHEDVYRDLMRLHALTLNRAGALRTYYTCATVLQRELNVEPSSATRQVYQQIVNQREPTLSLATLATNVPLVGRQAEWTQLQQAWRQAHIGQPSLFLICGEAGIGKTRLAEEMMDWARRQGIAVAGARCYAAGEGLAYAPVAAWLRARPLPLLAAHWKSEIARILPELLSEDDTIPTPSSMTERWQRQHLFDALSLAILQESQPLLLMLDDTHWSDRETLEWLEYVFHSRATAHLLVLATVRPEELGQDHRLPALLGALRRSGHVTEIELAPLEPAETAALARQIAGRELDPKLAARLYKETEGNPLFLVEYVRSGILDASEMRDELPAPIPPTVQSVLRARLDQLSPPARELAGVAATAGREFTFDILQQASGYESEILVRALDELWRRRIVREHGTTGYDFSHDKLREALYADLSVAHRRLLHSKIAQALQSLHASQLEAVSGEVATHLEQAGAVKSAVPFYERAAGAARRVFANEDAIALYRRGLDLIEQMPNADELVPCALRLGTGCGDLLHTMGQHDKAREAYRRVLKYLLADDSLGTARFERKIGATFTSQGRYDEALEFYRRAEAALGDTTCELEPSEWQEWIDLQFDQFDLSYGRADVREMMRLAARARPIVEHHGTLLQRARLYQLFVQINFRRDRYIVTDETLAYARAAAIAESGSPREKELMHFPFGFTLLWRGELDEAEEQLLAAQAWDEQVGNSYELTLSLTYLAILYRKRGQVEQVRCYAAQALQIAISSELPSYIATAHANHAWLAWREKKYKEARTEAEAALGLWPSTYPFQWTAIFPLIARLVRRNQIEQAIRHARVLCQPLQQKLPDALTRNLEQAIRAWDQKQAPAAREHLQRALESGEPEGYV